MEMNILDILGKILSVINPRNREQEQKCDITFTTITKDGIFRPNCTEVAFWNQGNQEVIISGSVRLAPSKLNTTTGKYEGGEAYKIGSTTGRVIITSYDIVFNSTTTSGGQQPLNKLTVQMLNNMYER